MKTGQKRYRLAPWLQPDSARARRMLSSTREPQSPSELLDLGEGPRGSEDQMTEAFFVSRGGEILGHFPFQAPLQ